MMPVIVIVLTVMVIVITEMPIILIAKYSMSYSRKSNETN